MKKIEIVYFHWSKKCAPSIVRSFNPLINALHNDYCIKEYRVPYMGANPINIIRNIVFVYKRSTKFGINHVTGDIHYVILGLLGRKSVLTVHDDYAIIKAPNFCNMIYKWIFWLFLPVKLATRVIYISNETYKKVSKYVKRSDAQVLPHHVIDEHILFNPKYDINKDCPRLLQIGTTEQKNLETTIEVASKLNCHLRIIKKMTDEQKRMCLQLGVDFSNSFNLSDEEIATEFDNADIVLAPSLYEGFGMPALEAQTIGRAVITTDKAPMNWVTGGKAAMLHNPLDVDEYYTLIKRLIEDDEYRKNIIDKGYENSKRFQLQNVKHSYLKFYRELQNA